MIKRHMIKCTSVLWEGKEECSIRILSSHSLGPHSEADLYLGLKPEFTVNLKCWEK